MPEATQLLYILFSTFCGWGGGDRGLHDAGFFTPWAIDWERHARDCFKLNFPTTRVEGWDLFYKRIEFIMREFGIRKAESDGLLIASPCQGVSSAGKCNPYDRRNVLTLRALKYYVPATSPRFFLLENVEGLTEAPMAPFFNLMQEELDILSDEYDIVHDVLNTKGFGVPQARDRFILLGVHKSLGVKASLPDPTHFGDEGLRICDVLPYLEGIHYGYGGKKLKYKEEICNTITKTPNIWAREDGIMRDFRIEELLKFCAYPADWKYGGSYGQVWNRIGNSIMPLFMKKIGEHVRINILEKAGVPKRDVTPYIQANLAFDEQQQILNEQKIKTKSVTSKNHQPS
jgi:DNA (cytosine-5)-methyltransferase 1